MNKNNYIAIMAGGVGSRFWPASRESRPKQFLDILGVGRSLIQLTFDRAAKIVPRENILIVSNGMYKDLILEQLPGINENQLLLEPSRNNTAPCVAYTALHLKAKNPKAVFAMLPSDHVILKEQEFLNNLGQAFDFAASHEAIVTLGIQPTRPDTGYGYINFNRSEEKIFTVKEFKEKPTTEVAQQYLDSGNYLWNAGIFVWSTQTILKEYSKSSPEILEVLCADETRYGTKSEQDYINEVYPQTKDISVDFAILEHAKNVYTIPADIGWSDLGTWNSLYDFLDKDDSENALLLPNRSVQSSHGNMIRTSDTNKLIVVKGLKDYIIIDDDDVLLIYPRHEEQQIKQLRATFEGTKFV